MSRLDEAKEIDLVGYLSSIGYEPKKYGNGKTWFLSPIHMESAPSFIVKGRHWCDYGATSLEKPFGDVVDLCQEVNSCSRMEAVDLLLNGTSVVKFEPREVVDESKLTILNVYDEIKDQRLIDYLAKRNISENIYKSYLKEATYCFSSNPDKVYTACAFENDKHGYELRNQYHKYCCVPKHFTTLGEGTTLNLFEGNINFLSALCYFGVKELTGVTIVLNGLGMIRRVLEDMNQYKKINCFLDFGIGGDTAMDLIRAKVGTSIVYDHRYLHNEDEDMNDMLIRITKNKSK